MSTCSKYSLEFDFCRKRHDEGYVNTLGVGQYRGSMTITQGEELSNLYAFFASLLEAQ